MTRVSVPRGFRDFPPEIMLRRIEIIREIESVFRLYGFSPLETPVVEYWETLAGKYGEEAEGKLIWRFKDPLSDKMYALRYDLTVPLARFVAMHPELPLPFKRYQIGLVWRHEEPQRGRYREFVQADVDIVGSGLPEADAEIMNVITHALEKVGLQDYVLRVNHRVLMKIIYEDKLGIRDPIEIYRVVDKLDKIGTDGVRKELEKRGINESIIDEILSLASIKVPMKKIDEIREIVRIQSSEYERVLSELSVISDLLRKPEKALLDLSLVRGLDYYTGPIFEVILEEGSPGSVAGGGRYDDLIGIFRKQGSLPATGGSIGVERVFDVLVERGLIKLNKKTVTDVMIVLLDEELRKEAWRVADKLRELGVKVEVDLLRRSPAKQRKRAQVLGIRYLLFVGKKEVEIGKYALYDRVTGERKILSIEEVAREVKT